MKIKYKNQYNFNLIDYRQLMKKVKKVFIKILIYSHNQLDNFQNNIK
jgi:hypothetical protein